MILKPTDFLPVGEYAGRLGHHVTDRFAIWNLDYIDGHPKAVAAMREMSETHASVFGPARWAAKTSDQRFELPASTPNILGALRDGSPVTWTGLTVETRSGTRRTAPALVLVDADGQFHYVDARYRDLFLDESLRVNWFLALPAYKLGMGAEHNNRVTKVVATSAAEPQCRVGALMLLRPDEIVGIDYLRPAGEQNR